MASISLESKENLTASQLATRKVLDWAFQNHGDVIVSAGRHLIGDYKEDEVIEKFGKGEAGSQFISQLVNEYAILDFEDENINATLAELYLEENGWTLTKEERQSLEIKLPTYKTLYEVQESRPGEGLYLKDCFSGEKFWVKEDKGSWEMKKWDIIFARVETYPMF